MTSGPTGRPRRRCLFVPALHGCRHPAINLPHGAIAEKPPEPQRISSATPAAFSARDTGFEPVAFGSGEQKPVVLEVPTDANPSDSLERDVANGPKNTSWTRSRTAPARHAAGQGGPPGWRRILLTIARLMPCALVTGVTESATAIADDGSAIDLQWATADAPAFELGAADASVHSPSPSHVGEAFLWLSRPGPELECPGPDCCAFESLCSDYSIGRATIGSVISDGWWMS